MKAPTLIAATLALTLFAAPTMAQTDDTAETAPADAEAPAETAADYGIDTELAEVDGTPVTLGELIAVRRELPAEYQQLPDQALYRGILEQLVDQHLLAEAAREAGIDQRPDVALQLATQARAILADTYLTGELRARVDDAAVEALYRERYVDADPVQEAKAAHILVETEEEASEIKAKLDDGAEFAALAEEHGTDGTAQRGGDLGWFSHDQMVPQFADAVFAMEPGEVRGPVETDFGWHLIRLDELRERPVPPLAEVRNDLLRKLAREAQLAVIEELRAKAEIDIPEQAPVPPAAIRADALLAPAE